MSAPDFETIRDLCAEVKRARAKHPGNARLFLALSEEVGEVAKALLEGEPPENVRAELLQVACVALRMAEEGDASYPSFVPPHIEPDENLN